MPLVHRVIHWFHFSCLNIEPKTINTTVHTHTLIATHVTDWKRRRLSSPIRIISHHISEWKRTKRKKRCTKSHVRVHTFRDDEKAQMKCVMFNEFNANSAKQMRNEWTFIPSLSTLSVRSARMIEEIVCWRQRDKQNDFHQTQRHTKWKCRRLPSARSVPSFIFIFLKNVNLMISHNETLTLDEISVSVGDDSCNEKWNES